MSNYKQVILVRPDLGMSWGEIARQCSHVSMMSVLNMMKINYGPTKTKFSLRLFNSDPMFLWLDNNYEKQIKWARSLDHMLNLKGVAELDNIQTTMIVEEISPGHSIEKVCAIGPDTKDRIDLVTRNLHLVWD